VNCSISRAALFTSVSRRITANSSIIAATQAYVTVGQTLKAARTPVFPAMAAALNYTPPSTNPYNRVADIDAALAVNTDEGGLAAMPIGTWAPSP